MPQPRISCLMVTQRSRIRVARRAIADFHAQTYPNTQLVVVADDATTMADLRDAVIADGAAGNDNIIVVGVAGGDYGTRRQAALEIAGGQACVQWDDDDRYHPYRLAYQFDELGAADVVGVALGDQLYLDVGDGSLFWVDYRFGAPNGAAGMAPSTLMFWKDALKGLAYAPGTHGVEDRFFSGLSRRGAIVPLRDRGWLTVKRVHHANASGPARLRAHIRGRAYTRPTLEATAAAARCEVRRYPRPWDVPRLTLRDNDRSPVLEIEVPSWTTGAASTAPATPSGS